MDTANQQSGGMEPAAAFPLPHVVRCGHRPLVFVASCCAAVGFVAVSVGPWRGEGLALLVPLGIAVVLLLVGRVRVTFASDHMMLKRPLSQRRVTYENIAGVETSRLTDLVVRLHDGERIAVALPPPESRRDGILAWLQTVIHARKFS